MYDILYNMSIYTSKDNLKLRWIGTWLNYPKQNVPHPDGPMINIYMVQRYIPKLYNF